MSDARIFLVNPAGNTLTTMDEKTYVTEDVLQAYLARYPELLPGDQIDPDNPRRWLLVAREMPIPGDESEIGRWSLDHLFLDQDGIPTFIECKRSSDTRARREVVAQMLDYAANGLEYWSPDKLRQAAAETAQKAGNTLEMELRRVLEADPGEPVDVEDYWQKVAANLKAGKVRLVFVADRTTKELRRLVEFLNEKLADVTVLAVEIKQFLGAGHTALVPRVLGLTETAREKKPAGRGKITEPEFLARCAPDLREFYAGAFERARERGFKVAWGTTGCSIRGQLSGSGQWVTFVYAYPPDVFDLYFGYLPVAESEMLALRKRLAGLGAFKLMGDKTLRIPTQPAPAAQFDTVWTAIMDEMSRLAAAY